eukprot:TRINITY_DN40871_c0_g1_i1.p1 TRINITY_DN40871_c0_g1~~TRINITY_DN40871_c0_g1_i1.p1  ORF type:complete len:272 (+),score=55.64 TRINITY_DN40871_c0_g1_i1:34-849(+)
MAVGLLKRVGLSVVGDAVDVESQEVAAARRVGLSAPSSNAEYQQRADQEIKDAESSLDEMRRKAKLLAARCNGHLSVVEKEVRAEVEQREISDRISRELQAFKRDLRDKEAREEERLSHLYRAMSEPHASADDGRGSYTGARLYDPGAGVPGLYHSAVSLITEDVAQPAVSYSEVSTPLKRDFDFAEPRARKAAPPARDFDFVESRVRRSAALSPTREFDFAESRAQRASFESRHIALPVAAAAARAAANEAEQLLRRNKERLKRLEKLGL